MDELVSADPGGETARTRSAEPSSDPGEQPVTPPEEVRRELVELAATAIAARPAAEVPGPLRPIARFTPARRARQGAAALWAEVSGNDEFRASLAELAETAMPDLAEAVRTGDVSHGADRIAVGTLRYLLRPPGWREGLEELARDLTAEREQRDLGTELARSREEVTRLRARVDELVRERDEARQAARSRDDSFELDVARLKKEIRALKGSLRQSETQVAHARESLAEVEARMAAAEAEHLAASRRSSSRIASLEAELDSIRRTGRAARDYDEVRLWLLLEQLSQAADGLRGMGLARDPGMRPADAVGVEPETEGARLSVLDDGALDRLLHGQHVHLILDGYNLTKNGYGELSLADQRSRLTSAARALAQRRDIEVTVVFDGQTGPSESVTASGLRHFRVRFSARGQTADDLIRDLLTLEPPGRTVIVASSDKEVAASARGVRAWSVTAHTMLERLGRG